VTRHPPIPGRGGAKIAFSHRPSLAQGKVMHVGEAVAMVVAESHALALDAPNWLRSNTRNCRRWSMRRPR